MFEKFVEQYKYSFKTNTVGVTLSTSFFIITYFAVAILNLPVVFLTPAIIYLFLDVYVTIDRNELHYSIASLLMIYMLMATYHV